MFHFGRFPSCTYVFSTGFMILHHEGFPIRKSAGRSLFAAHRSLSQLVTSFFGSWCQGIPLVLFFAWTPLYIFRYTLCSRLLELLCITFYSYFFSLAKLCFLFTQFYGKTFFLVFLFLYTCSCTFSLYSVFNEHLCESLRFACSPWPIFPDSHPSSIVGTVQLNFCVRNGNRWTLTVKNTNYIQELYPEN